MVTYNVLNIGSANGLVPSHQAITWTSADISSVKSCGIHLRAVSPEFAQDFNHNDML